MPEFIAQSECLRRKNTFYLVKGIFRGVGGTNNIR